MTANDHKHHIPADTDIHKIQAIRQKTIEFDALIEELCPEGRDKSLALTNLEQARMWAIAALVKNKPVDDTELTGTRPAPPPLDAVEEGCLPNV
jgi:hypothetical protein